MPKKFNLPPAAALVLPLLFAAPAGAQTAADGGAPLAITAGEINFGVVFASGRGETISLLCAPGADSSKPPDSFIIGGTCGVVTVANNSPSAINATFSVPQSILVSGADTISPAYFAVYDNAGSEIYPGAQKTLAANSAAQLEIGGFLFLAANQAPGNYAGTYTFTARIE